MNATVVDLERYRGASAPARHLRLAAAAAAFVLALLVLVTVFGTLPARGESAPRATVVVQEGETLEQLALRHLPDVEVKNAEFAIMRANNLPTSQVRAGDVLQIPAG